MQGNDLEVDVLTELVEVLLLLGHDAHKREDVHSPTLETQNLSQHEDFRDN